MRGSEGTALRILGEIGAAQDQFDLAEELTHQSIAVLEEIGDEYQRARGQLSLARMYAAQGKVTAAMTTLENCIPVFERSGAALDLEAARALLDEVA